MQRFSSLLIWLVVTSLVLFWTPLLLVTRLLDRDPVRYRTGYRFRTLGKLLSRVNPNWHVEIEGHEYIDDRNPYVMVSNHLSNADIPVISNLPWEMKWVAKRELFSLPIVGWMMTWAGDIPVDRGRGKQRLDTFKRAIYYLKNRVSVIFFPEGTRSPDGRMNRFTRGAFELAVREQVPILPLVIDGTQGCLPKNSWVFEPDVRVKLKILDPIPTKGLGRDDTEQLMEDTRHLMVRQLARMRGVDEVEVDRLAKKRNN
jgi:1-acyl-sn-glycerol-3-phosphate acyltransferase